MDFAVGAAARRLSEAAGAAATAAAAVVAAATTDTAPEDAPAELGGIDAADARAAVASDPSRSYKLMLGAAVIVILGAYLCFRGGKNRLAAFFAKFFYFNTLIQIRLFSILDCYCGYDRSTALTQRCPSRTPRDAPRALIRYDPEPGKVLMAVHTNGMGHVKQAQRLIRVLARQQIPVDTVAFGDMSKVDEKILQAPAAAAVSTSPPTSHVAPNPSPPAP